MDIRYPCNRRGFQRRTTEEARRVVAQDGQAVISPIRFISANRLR